MPKRRSQRSCLKLLPLIGWWSGCSTWSSRLFDFVNQGFPAEPPDIFHAFFSVSGASCFASIITALTKNPGQIWRASAKAFWVQNYFVFFFVSRLGTCKPKGTKKKAQNSAKLIEAPGIATVIKCSNGIPKCQGVFNSLCCSEKKHMAFDMPVLQHLQLFNEDIIKILLFVRFTNQS